MVTILCVNYTKDRSVASVNYCPGTYLKPFDAKESFFIVMAL